MKMTSCKRSNPAWMLALLALAFAALSGCCETTVEIGGRVRDAGSSELLDSVNVTFLYYTKNGVEVMGEYTSDSLGNFGYYDFGYCGKEHFFIVASKDGYVSQSLDVEIIDNNIELLLEAE